MTVLFVVNTKIDAAPHQLETASMHNSPVCG